MHTHADVPASDPGLRGPREQRGWRSQFGHPRGVLGRVAGRIMARLNEPLYALVVERLRVGPKDRVLEIGFGHGRALGLLAARAAGGLVAGIDPSATMLRQAARHNKAAVSAGRVVLQRASVERIPHTDGSFTRVCGTNCLHHWPDAAANLREVRRVLAPGGRLVLGVRVQDPGRGRFSPPGLRPEQLQQTLRLMREAGFREARLEQHHVGRAVCLLIATA